ncbi:hypothetical protein H5410_058259 [Solanum commersonii]|uniref:Uncharacterized protein n=1 Tax=Solanum commersonii TaxID=4109 RepID=A0A9J5WS50_SOLCO|nr:hypothetical protein H5410_058259 [Solanum commersonii]
MCVAIYLMMLRRNRSFTWLPKKFRCTVQSRPPISFCPPVFCPEKRSHKMCGKIFRLNMNAIPMVYRKGRAAQCTKALCMGSREGPDHKGLLFAALTCNSAEGCFHDLNP